MTYDCVFNLLWWFLCSESHRHFGLTNRRLLHHTHLLQSFWVSSNSGNQIITSIRPYVYHNHAFWEFRLVLGEICIVQMWDLFVQEARFDIIWGNIKFVYCLFFFYSRFGVWISKSALCVHLCQVYEFCVRSSMKSALCVHLCQICEFCVRYSMKSTLLVLMYVRF